MMNQKRQERSSISTDPDRLLPQSVDYERAVISALLSERQVLPVVLETLTPEMFYNIQLQAIFQAIVSLDGERKPVDMLTVTQHLKREGNLELVGGVSSITSIATAFVSSSDIEYKCNIVKQKYISRKAIEIYLSATDAAFDETRDISDVIEHADKLITELMECATGKKDIKTLDDVLEKSVAEMYTRKQKADEGVQYGVSTGLADLNGITGGWQKGDLIVIGGRAAMGKTAVALHFAKKAAMAGTAVAVFSLEMSDVSLGNRFLLSESEVNPDNFRTGRLSDGEMKQIEAARKKLRNLGVFIDDNPSVTMRYILSRCRMLKKRGQCGMAVIDYLQLAAPQDENNRNGNREQEVSRMSREAKLIAKELQIPVLLLTQLNREVEKRADKRPMLSDIRESGAIEQDADMVCFVYRPEYYDKKAEKGYGEFIIAKYRNGVTGAVKFRYNESVTKIFDWDYSGMAKLSPEPQREIKNYYEKDETPF